MIFHQNPMVGCRLGADLAQLSRSGRPDVDRTGSGVTTVGCHGCTMRRRALYPRCRQEKDQRPPVIHIIGAVEIFAERGKRFLGMSLWRHLLERL